MTADSPESRDQTQVSELTGIVGDMLARYEDLGPEAIEAACQQHPDKAKAIRNLVGELARFGFLQGEREAGEEDSGEEVPRQLGEFVLLDLLGSGGMGVVYRAHQESLSREVALKLIRPEQVYFPKAMDRFRREVEALAKLEHPGIVHVYASGVARGIPFFAMELLRGASLHQLLSLAGSEKKLMDGAGWYRLLQKVDADQVSAAANTTSRDPDAEPPSKSTSDETTRAGLPELFRGSWAQCSARIALRVAEALNHAHGHGILHRDVKPSNVMVTLDGRVQLLDFGLAHTDRVSELTRPGAHLGSLPYMSPEQLQGSKVDARTDVYGLGVTLYELVSRIRAFDQKEDSRLREAILAGQPARPSALMPGLPRDIETICLKAMHVDPAQRYQGIDEMARDLRAFLELRPIEARRPALSYRMRRYAQRHPARATGAVALVLLAVVGPIVYGRIEARAAEREREISGQLRTALEDKQREFSRAETNLAKAREAIDKMVEQVSQPQLSSLPGIDALRAKALEEAVHFYDELEPVSKDDPRHLWERARSRLLVASLRVRLGDGKRAERELQWVIASLEKLAPLHKEQLVVARDLATAYKEMARIHGTTGRSQTAMGYLRRAVEVLRNLVDAHPDMRGYRIDLVTEISNLANRELRLGHRDQTKQLLDEAEGLLARKEDSGDPFVVLERATLLADRGRLAHVTGQLDVARARYAASLEMLETLDERELPSIQRERRRRSLGDQAYSLSGVAQLQKDLDPAIAFARKAMAYRRDFAANHPQRPQAQSRWASARAQLGDLLVRKGEKKEGLRHLRAAIQIQEKLIVRYPERTEYRRSAAVSYSNLGTLLGGEEGQELIDKSLAIWKSLVGDQPQVPSYRSGYSVALNFAFRLAKDPARRQSLAAEAVRQLREVLVHAPDSRRYRAYLSDSLAKEAAALVALGRSDEAIARLREAIQYGYPRSELDQPAFEALRVHKDFQALLVGKDG